MVRYPRLGGRRSTGRVWTARFYGDPGPMSLRRARARSFPPFREIPLTAAKLPRDRFWPKSRPHDQLATSFHLEKPFADRPFGRFPLARVATYRRISPSCRLLRLGHILAAARMCSYRLPRRDVSVVSALRAGSEPRQRDFSPPCGQVCGQGIEQKAGHFRWQNQPRPPWSGRRSISRSVAE